jgi:hypothetical protein
MNNDEGSMQQDNLNFLQPPLLQFFNRQRESIGVLDTDEEGFLVFDGDVDESAKKLFESVIAYNSVKIKQYRDALLAISIGSSEEEIQKIAKSVL